MFRVSSLLAIRRWSSNATNWSPLAEAFNAKPKQSSKFLKKDVGLFKVDQLISHEGFYTLKKMCTIRTVDLIKEALNSNRKRKMVAIFDELSDTLCQVADMAEFVRLAHPDRLYNAAAEYACSAISGIVENLNTNLNLYKVLKATADNGDIEPNTEEEKLLVDLFLFDFEQCGIHLPAKQREEVVMYHDKIFNLGQQFVAASALPRTVKCESIPKHCRFIFPLYGDNDIKVHALYADSADMTIREAAYRIYLHPDSEQEQRLKDLLKARNDLAKLCGFNTYSERALKGTVMEDPKNVLDFLNILSEGIKDKAHIDFNMMEQMKHAEDPNSGPLAMWDIAYYHQKAKKELFELSPLDYSPYFSLGACMEGLNMIFKICYGVTLEPTETAAGETWSSDVHKLAVIHETDGVLGYIYCDFFERNGKPNQDCHFTIRGGKVLPDGSYQQPIVVLMLNFSIPHWHSFALLTPSMVDNLFHEMGHAMHSMLGRTTYQHVTGTRCSTDLAEVPSILMEYFASDPRVLRLFAKHFQTNQPIPEDMLEKLCASKRLFAASEAQMQIFYSVLDQVYHGEFESNRSTTDIFSEVHEKYYSLPYVANTAWQFRFSHLIGYGAKYYSYLVSRALAYWIWKRYFESDPLNRTQGEKYWKEFLAHGGGKRPRLLLTDFLEIEPVPTHLAEYLITEIEDHQKQVISVIKKITQEKSSQQSKDNTISFNIFNINSNKK